MTLRRPALSPRHRAPPLRELEIHLAVADLLRKAADPRWEWSHFPAGEKREKQTAYLLQQMGVKPGWPDFLLIAPTGHLYCLELKSNAGDLEEEQFAFFQRMRARGIECRVARSPEEAGRILAYWGAIRADVSQFIEKSA